MRHYLGLRRVCQSLSICTIVLELIWHTCLGELVSLMGVCRQLLQLHLRWGCCPASFCLDCIVLVGIGVLFGASFIC
jgi:hypothetical protein